MHMSTLAVCSTLWRSLDKMGYTLANRWQPTPGWQESASIRRDFSNVDDELVLLAQARRLNPDALAEVHDRYYPAIYRYIAYRVGDTQVAEDLTSEVFTRLLSALRDRNAPQNTLRGWLYAVARRSVSDYHRKGFRRPQVELAESLPSRDANPLEIAEANMNREALMAAIGELTDDQQQVIGLRFGSEMPIQEVAETMGKTEGAVKQLQARALAALARMLSAGDQ
jgi:RNA polymerase sigma-70 factor (ECF subfamily)